MREEASAEEGGGQCSGLFQSHVSPLLLDVTSHISVHAAREGSVAKETQQASWIDVHIWRVVSQKLP